MSPQYRVSGRDGAAVGALEPLEQKLDDFLWFLIYIPVHIRAINCRDELDRLREYAVHELCRYSTSNSRMESSSFILLILKRIGSIRFLYFHYS